MTWKPDGNGVLPGGDIGGDEQVTASARIRFVDGERPGAIVTVSAYGVVRGSRFGVAVQTEFQLGTGAELWARKLYSAEPLTYATAKAAEATARKRAASTTPSKSWDDQFAWKRFTRR